VAAAETIDADIAAVVGGADRWARNTIAERVAILRQIRSLIGDVAAEWVAVAADRKLIPQGSQLEGEEWLSGPYALLCATDQLIETLEAVDAGNHLDQLDTRDLPNGQLAVEVVPHSIWDRLLLGGVTAEVWMLPGVSSLDLILNAAGAYASSVPTTGRVAVVLGAGNVSSIAPLDCYHKLFSENAVVILKPNPVNDYMAPILSRVFAPLIDRDALRIVLGDGAVGEYLVNHASVDEIHITGSGATHDNIVWGAGAEGAANKLANSRRNTRRITSELGAVCPTIVVPGPWTNADLKYQAQHIATQKLHNNGYNCVACQVLVMPSGWEHSAELLSNVETALETAPRRGMYYPGTDERLDRFAHSGEVCDLAADGSQDRRLISKPGADIDGLDQSIEVFGPALRVVDLDGANAEEFLATAIDCCNSELYGTLGANVLIHPKTVSQLGDRFDDLLVDLHYGCIAVNGWTGIGFGLTRAPWGAFPGHTLDDVGSGIGVVHNTLMMEGVERTVVTAPFRPFPRSVFHGEWTLLPKPPWFVNHRRAAQLGKLLTSFQLKPTIAKLPRLFATALRG